MAYACANQQNITGGPKDEQPPSLLSSFPEDQSVNYKMPMIELTFDEYVSATSLKKELLITPITEMGYEVKTRKNVVTITFDSLFEANTTYTLNFRKGIVDITEKNAPENLRIAFSTGNVIDSLEISGTVNDVLTAEPEAEASVILYKESDTLTVKGGKAMYMVKTDGNGYYYISNLKAGTYQVIALKEQDDNLIYSKAEEKVGFLPNPIKLDSSLSDINLQTIAYDNTPLEFQRIRVNKQYIDLTFNKKPDSLLVEIDGIPDPDNILVLQKEEVARLFQRTQSPTDTFQVAIKAYNKLDLVIDTIVAARFEETKRPLEDAFEVKFLPESDEELLKSDSFKLEITLSKPVEVYNPDSIILRTITDTTVWNVSPKNYLSRSKWIFTDTMPQLPVEIEMKSGSFISIEGDSLPPQILTYKPKLAENYGTLTGKVNLPKMSFILELLNNGEVEQRIANQKEFIFRWVTPGAKKLRILIDENGNGTWDKGDFPSRRLPEPIYYYPKPIDVKANWEIALDIITEEVLDNKGNVNTKSNESPSLEKE